MKSWLNKSFCIFSSLPTPNFYHIHHIFYFLYPDALRSGASLNLEGLPFPGLASSWKQTTYQWRCFPNRNPPIQSPHSLLIRLSSTRSLSSYPNRPQGQVQNNQGQSPMPQSPLKWLKPVNSKSAQPASPAPSSANHKKDSFAHTPLFSLSPDLSWCFLVCVFTPFLLGTESHNLPYQTPSPDLGTLLCLRFPVNVCYF